MPIIPERLREQIKVFTWILPYPESEKINPMEKHLGVTFKEIVPAVLELLLEDMIKNPEHTEMYFDWIANTILYVTGQIDEPPPVEYNPKGDKN